MDPVLAFAHELCGFWLDENKDEPYRDLDAAGVGDDNSQRDIRSNKTITNPVYLCGAFIAAAAVRLPIGRFINSPPFLNWSINRPN
jgi:hypothetical protein